MRRALLALSLALPAAARAQSVAEPPRGAAALAQAVDALGMTARVLVVGAHPDDEDTRLIAYLARGRHAETAYLSLTRGDGGQNLIGNELGEALGAIRTEELLAARRLDGGRQYFARAFDFGFSKSAEETFRHWPRDTVLGDVVRVVRAFRPHVVIAIFSGTRADGHGHHEASGILAREAYDAAADTVRFPARAFGPAWAVGKFYRNTSYRGAETATLRYNAGAYDPVLGRSYAELAAISRTQHKSQGQGGAERKGVSVISMRREAARANAGVVPNAERDLFEGVDTTAAGVGRDARCGAAGAAESGARLAAAVARVPAARAGGPDSLLAALGPALAAVRALEPNDVATKDVTSLACAPVRRAAWDDLFRLERRLNAVGLLASGVAVEALAPRAATTPGERPPVTLTVYNRARRPIGVTLGATDVSQPVAASLAPDSAVTVTVPPMFVGTGSWVSGGVGPWWLRAGRAGDLFRAPVTGLDEEANTAAPTVAGVVTLGGVELLFEAPVVFRRVDPVDGQVDRPVATVPRVSVTMDRAVQYARSGPAFDRVLHVRVTSTDSVPRPVTVRLTLPAGLAADSAARAVTVGGGGSRADVAFRLRGTLAAGRHVIRAAAESNGERFTTGYQLLDYDHIRPQRLYRPAEVALEAVDVALPPRARVAYVPGVSDNVAPALADLGLDVTVLDGAALGAADLSRFTHVVVGPRAYEANAALQANNARLLAWTAAGGTMVVQYGQYEMTRPGVMPYPVTLGRPAQRVTIEEAPVTPLGTPRVLLAPNRLGAADWRGWVQERSTYMPATADPHYQTAVSLADPGEPANPNGILVAPVGRGTYVYVTLALFRQLPAGVPGAARLVANLLAARAEPSAAPPRAAAAAGR